MWRTLSALLPGLLLVTCAGPSDRSVPSDPTDTASLSPTPEQPAQPVQPGPTAQPISPVQPVQPAPVEPAFDPGEREYPWLKGAKPGEPLWRRFQPPAGFARVETETGSFGNWLRHLPLKPDKPPVLLHDGSPKGRQDVHAAVLDVDVGRRDLQQCVDACMRLRAEYLWSAGRSGDVCFKSVGGPAMSWKKWKQGYRPDGRRWSKTASPAGSWRAFRSYMDKVFGTCNTRSQLEQMIPVGDPSKLEIGHIFLNRPNPDYFGHAVMVVDAAVDAQGRKAFLLVQSYMPAQEIHVLLNHRDSVISPWFILEEGEDLVTPEWTFASSDLVRYPERGCSD